MCIVCYKSPLSSTSLPPFSFVSLYLAAQITGLGPSGPVQSSRNPQGELMIACDYSPHAPLPPIVSSVLIWPGPAEVTLSTLESLTRENRSEERLTGEALTRFLHLDIAWRLHHSFCSKVRLWEVRVMWIKGFWYIKGPSVWGDLAPSALCVCRWKTSERVWIYVDLCGDMFIAGLD